MLLIPFRVPYHYEAEYAVPLSRAQEYLQRLFDEVEPRFNINFIYEVCGLLCPPHTLFSLSAAMYSVLAKATASYRQSLCSFYRLVCTASLRRRRHRLALAGLSYAHHARHRGTLPGQQPNGRRIF